MRQMITTDDFIMAYNDASEQSIRKWNWDGAEFDDWAGDCLYDFISEFLHALGIEVIAD